MTRKQVKPIKAEQLNRYYEESLGLERELISEFIKSRKTAWRVAGVVGIFGLFGMMCGVVGFSQPAPTPLVLRVDNTTGAVDVISVMREHETSYGEVVDRYWLNQYVLNRETYDYDTIQLNYDTAALLSAPAVQQEFYKIYDGENARDQVLSNKARIIVKVRSIQPNGLGQATVRFTTQQYNSNGTAETKQHQIATIGYTYVGAPMKSSDRLLNPLGFQVTSYRADPEILLNN
ncbi:TrwG protein [Bartonella henselae]|uniref:Type IV secretion system protein virB8 n=2 Tax=Bartonella henselae TaxID=38323 RepID=B0RK82_BARHN|nr:type IV secrection system protein TrwG [Bartonella henselae]OLL50082.1 TrwG protein [Bartonella henselae]OLL53157.1 TrwG protein [Bartonella henselae]OLL55910.1 TrwG protein [Bartonella henselae]OLL58833.1 TrwG protein [Bartonella henselae]UJM32356.1 type IV secrection system protein TrwG [Bartonella henselae]